MARRGQAGATRRVFLAGATAALAMPARAQRLPLVAHLSLRSRAGNAALDAAFERGLADGGFADNKNVAIAWASANGRSDELKPLAEELLRRQPAVLYASSSAAAVAAKAATSTVPIVYVGASDPVKLGLVQSLARPGGNLTGYTMYAHTFSAKRLEILNLLVPQARTIGVLVNPANPSAGEEARDLQAAAAILGLALSFVEVRRDGDIAAAFAGLRDAKIRALYMVDDPLFGTAGATIAALALDSAIGVISTLRSLSMAGALASYGTDFEQVHHDAALYVARILRGEKPADLPVLLPTRFTLTLNQKTARALGLSLSPSVLARADEVLE